jgi:hypothetical protein
LLSLVHHGPLQAPVPHDSTTGAIVDGRAVRCHVRVTAALNAGIGGRSQSPNSIAGSATAVAIGSATFGSTSLGLRRPPDAGTMEVVGSRPEEWAVRLDNA